MSNRITDLRMMDGLSFYAADMLPHPVEMSRWAEAGWYVADVDRGVLRLTDAGRRAIAAGDPATVRQ